MKYKILALFGPSGAGKDTIQKWYAEHADINEIVSATTRPPREYEQDSVDYHFLSDSEFTDKVLNGDMLEATSFREWYYGTPIDSLKADKVNVGVFNIQGIEILLEDERVQVLPVLVHASDKARVIRCLTREAYPDVYEVCRRFMKDTEDFSNIPFRYEFYNNEYDINERELESFLDDLKQD